MAKITKTGAGAGEKPQVPDPRQPPEQATSASPPPADADAPDTLEGASTPSAPGPTQGELDELRDDNLNLAAENAQLRARQEESEQRLARLERLLQGKAAYTPTGIDREPDEDHIPAFDESEPHGIVYGHDKVAFEQNGCQFGRDKEYLGRNKNAGSPRPFNPKLVGFVRPRPQA